MSINAFGKPLGEAAKRFTRQHKDSSRLAGKQPHGGFAQAVPETSQWQCRQCGHPNLGRSVVCGNCGEERDGRDVIEGERAA